jgi:hypothetical protein
MAMQGEISNARLNFEKMALQRPVGIASHPKAYNALESLSDRYTIRRLEPKAFTSRKLT